VSGGRTYISHAREEQQQYINGLLRENEKLRGAAAIAGENQRFAEQYQHIEEQSSNLANLYVASYQLHTSVDRDVVLNTIQEIVINLIGSEQLAIYERVGEKQFRLAASFGFDTDHLAALVTGEYAVEKLGEGHVFSDPSDSQPLTASVQLRIGDEVTGAILVFRLLGHKPSLQPVDHELFDLLAVHASTALYCSTLHGVLTVVE
jgi:hypothetical protein